MLTGDRDTDGLTLTLPAAAPPPDRLVSVHLAAARLSSCAPVTTANSAREELGAIVKLSWPVALALLASIAMQVTDIAMLGYYSTEALAAASIAFVWINATTAMLYRGLGSTINTLVSQAIGADNRPLAGVWLQIGLLVISISCLPVGALWFATRPLCRLLGLSARLSSDAALFATISLGWLWPSQVFSILQSYFQSLNNVQPALVINAIFVLVNLGANYVLIFGIRGYWAGLGFIGSPLATTFTRWVMLVIYVLWLIVYRKAHLAAWTPWSLREYTRSRLRIFLVEQSLPNLLGGLLEEWQLQLISGFAVALGPIAVATHNAMLMLFFLLTSFMFGITTAIRVRISAHLGANQPASARRAAAVGLGVSSAMGCVIGGLLVLLRNYLGHLFSSDPEVIELTSRICWIVGLAYAMLSLFYVSMGVLESQGRPLPVAVSFLIGCWLASVPASYAFAFTLHYGLLGLWYGMVLGYGITTLISSYYAVRSNWAQEAVNAIERAERKAHKVAETEPLLAQPSNPASLNYNDSNARA